MVTMDNKLIVITQSGDVFGHDVVGRGVGDAFKFTGSRAAFNGPLDRFVVTTDNKLIVITQGGDVFGHDIEGRHVRDPFKFTGSRAAFNGPQDQFVVTMDNMLIVITQSGDVFGHDFVGRTVDDPFKFNGSEPRSTGPRTRSWSPWTTSSSSSHRAVTSSAMTSRGGTSATLQVHRLPAAFNGPQDRFVVTIDNKLLVITQSGDVFGHDINGRHIGDAFFLNPADDPLTITLTTFECTIKATRSGCSSDSTRKTTSRMRWCGLWILGRLLWYRYRWGQRTPRRRSLGRYRTSMKETRRALLGM